MGLTIKTYDARPPQIDDEQRRIKFVISTPDPDRDNDVVSLDGWDWTNYLKNPVVLWAHSHNDLPIGKCVQIGKVNGKQLVATAEFARAEENPRAEQVFQLYRRGFLSATSVGFKALDACPRPDGIGTHFLSQELLEFSCVPVPANQYALIAAATQGIDVKWLRDWAQRTLAATDETPTLEISDDEPVLEVDERLAEIGRRAQMNAARLAGLVIDVDKDQLVTALHSATRDALRTHIRTEIERAVNQLRGRVD